MNQLQVIVVHGVSGSGTSTLSQELARKLGWTWMQSDDLRIAFNAANVSFNQGVTHPLHFDRTPVDEFLADDPVELSRRMIDVATAMCPAVEVVVENHVLQSWPMVIEGDSIHPDLITAPTIENRANEGRVAFCCLAPPSRRDLLEIMLGRNENEAILTTDQVETLVSFQWRDAEWIVARCRGNGIPIVDSLSRVTLLDRVIRNIGNGNAWSTTAPMSNR